MSLLQIYQWVCQGKNFENRLTLGEVMGKSLVSCFLRHSVHTPFCSAGDGEYVRCAGADADAQGGLHQLQRGRVRRPGRPQLSHQHQQQRRQPQPTAALHSVRLGVQHVQHLQHVVHQDRKLYDLRSSAAASAFRQPSPTCRTAFPAQHLRPSGVLICRPDGLELTPGFYPGSNEQHRLV